MVIVQNVLQKLECSDKTKDHIRMPLDVVYLIASNIQRGTHKKEAPLELTYI